MVYESDFYTTRRPYRTTPSYSTYTVSRREVPWEKVPFVPRPSLVPDPVTAFGRGRQQEVRQLVLERQQQRASVLSAAERAKIRPKVLTEPPLPYVSARDVTRERVLSGVRRREMAPRDGDNLDVLLSRLHKVAECPDLPYKRQIVASSDFPPVW